MKNLPRCMVEKLLNKLAIVVLCAAWLSGFVLAQGFWSTLACFYPFWSWYLVLEKIFEVNGWI